MKVFISYSHVDKDIVEKMTSFFDEVYIPYFLDEKDIKWGDDIKKVIKDTLDNEITHELVIISPASLKSQWVWYELGFATAKKIKVLPYLTHPSIDVPAIISAYNYMTDMKGIKEYFTAQNDCRKTMTIIDNDGSQETVEVVVAFEFKDNKKEYVVYTKNERDVAGNLNVYVSNVDRSSGNPKLMGVESEQEWERIKDILREIARTDIDSGDTYTVPYPNIKLLDKVIFCDVDGMEII